MTQPPTQPPSFPFQPGPHSEPPAEYELLHGQPELPRVRLNNGSQALLATRYDHVTQVLTDRRFSRSAATGGTLFARSSESLPLITTDAPVHSDRRAAVAHAFTGRSVRAMRPMVANLADEQLAELAAGPTPADLVEGFAVPFTVRVICRILGVPSNDYLQFKPWVDRMMSIGRFPQEQVDECHQRFHGYFAGLVDAALAAIDRGETVPGLIGDLLAPPNPRSRHIGRDDVVVLSAGLLIAGYETTSNVLATVVYHLLRRPELMAQLREGPERADTVLEELLRFMCANGTGGVPHVATADVPLAGGVVVPEGETVVPVPDAANRDPAVFDEPAHLRTDRRPNPHIAFGHGAHYCLGAELARLELRVGVSALVSRFPALRIAVGDDELRWRTDMFVRGLWRLPVAW